MNYIYVHPEQYYLSETQSISGYKRWNVRKRADGINETYTRSSSHPTLSGTPTVLTVQGGMGTSGGDSVLRYYNPDGVNDYIGPTLSASQMNEDAYGRALSYDSDGCVFAAGDVVAIWVLTKDGVRSNPLIGWGNCHSYGFGLFWNPGATSGTLSAIVNNYEYETVPYSQLRYTSEGGAATIPYWNYLLIDTASGKLFINGEEATYREGSYGLGSGDGISQTPGGNPPFMIDNDQSGWLPLPADIGPASNQNWDGSSGSGSGIEYLEIGRAMKDKSKAGSNPPWTFSSYLKTTTNTFYGEVQVWSSKTEGGITHAPEIGNNFKESTARYFYNITLSAGQLGYYHAQTL